MRKRVDLDMTYKELDNGVSFRFDHTGLDFVAASYLCRKLTARRYEYNHNGSWYPCPIGLTTLAVIIEEPTP